MDIALLCLVHPIALCALSFIHRSSLNAPLSMLMAWFTLYIIYVMEVKDLIDLFATLFWCIITEQLSASGAPHVCIKASRMSGISEELSWEKL
jgi:hypothetical protein